MSLTFRTARSVDTPNILALLSTCFRTPPSQADWDWFTRLNPYGKSRVCLALTGGEQVAAVYCFAPTRLTIEGKSTQTSYGHHLAFDPKHRNALSFVEFSRFAFANEIAHGTDFVIGPPNKNAYLPHKILMQWFDFGFLEYLSKSRPADRQHSCVELHEFDAAFDEFFDRVSRGMSVYFSKTSAWMNWRFFRRPGAPYTVYAAYDGARITGYVVVKKWVEASGYRKVHIMDLRGETAATIANLLAAAEAYGAAFDEINTWSVLHDAYRAPLEAAGFINQPDKRQPLLARALRGPAMAFPAGPASFMYGDGDGY